MDTTTTSDAIDDTEDTSLLATFGAVGDALDDATRGSTDEDSDGKEDTSLLATFGEAGAALDAAADGAHRLPKPPPPRPLSQLPLPLPPPPQPPARVTAPPRPPPPPPPRAPPPRAAGVCLRLTQWMRAHVWSGEQYHSVGQGGDEEAEDDGKAEHLNVLFTATPMLWWLAAFVTVVRQVCCCMLCVRRMFPRARCGRMGCFGVWRTVCAVALCWCRSRPYRQAMCCVCGYMACVTTRRMGTPQVFVMMWGVVWGMLYLWATVQASICTPVWLAVVPLHMATLAPSLLCNVPVGGVRGTFGTPRAGDHSHDDDVPPLAAAGALGKFATCFQASLLTSNVMLLWFAQRHAAVLAWPALAWPVLAVASWYVLVVGAMVVMNTEDVEEGDGGSVHALCSRVLVDHID